jgi:hypothetical protein
MKRGGVCNRGCGTKICSIQSAHQATSGYGDKLLDIGTRTVNENLQKVYCPRSWPRGRGLTSGAFLDSIFFLDERPEGLPFILSVSLFHSSLVRYFQGSLLFVLFLPSNRTYLIHVQFNLPPPLSPLLSSQTFVARDCHCWQKSTVYTVEGIWASSPLFQGRAVHSVVLRCWPRLRYLYAIPILPCLLLAVDVVIVRPGRGKSL